MQKKSALRQCVDRFWFWIACWDVLRFRLFLRHDRYCDYGDGVLVLEKKMKQSE